MSFCSIFFRSIWFTRLRNVFGGTLDTSVFMDDLSLGGSGLMGLGS